MSFTVHFSPVAGTRACQMSVLHAPVASTAFEDVTCIACRAMSLPADRESATIETWLAS